MQFLQKVISGNKHRFCYLQAVASDGLNAWYFILLQPSKLAAFNKLPDDQPFDIVDYGQIIESGYGKAAPKEVIERINKEYETSFTY